MFAFVQRRTNSGTETPIKAGAEEEGDEKSEEKGKQESAPASSSKLNSDRQGVVDFLDGCGMNIRSYASKLAEHGAQKCFWR